MASRVRPLDHTDLDCIKSFSDLILDKSRKKLVLLGEEKYGLRIIFKKTDSNEMHIKMPSGNVFVRDLFETGTQHEQSLHDSGYRGDMSLAGEVANAICYSSLIQEEYLNARGLAR